MTLSELLRIGDEVVFKVEPERRACTDTYNDVPDGTHGIVCGFYDAVIYRSRIPVYTSQPGTYHQKGAVSVWLADGRVVPGDWSIDMVNKEEQKRRDTAMRDAEGILVTEQTRLGDLPPTKFWEMDKVMVNQEPMMMTISRIDYHHMHSKRDDGSPYPFYNVDYPQGGYAAATEAQITLVERGNLWKHHNNEPLSFSTLNEEASFFRAIGQAREVRNPANGLYKWSKDEALAAIREGTVHGFSMGGLFGSSSIITHRFNNKELGKRVAQATLKGFGEESS